MYVHVSHTHLADHASELGEVEEPVLQLLVVAVVEERDVSHEYT